MFNTTLSKVEGDIMLAQIIAMILFSLTMSITPGPVNVTTFSSGLNYGFKNTVPFVSGATIGFTLLLAGVGVGLGSIVNLLPKASMVLCYAGALFIAYVGYKIIRSDVSIEKVSGSRPKFHEGFVMQWLNIKAWVACIAGVSAFSLSGRYFELIMFCSIYFVVCYLSIASWAFMGNTINKLLNQDKYLKIINIGLGLTLVCLGVLIMLSGGEIG
jgi:threonine/homoserine/homoserine lactone efflux protein